MNESSSSPDFLAFLAEGVEHFNARRFWDAHESWETIWLEAEGDDVEFLQGLIQIAAAYHHLQRGTFPGGVRLFVSGAERLAKYPAGYCGLDRSEIMKKAEEHREWARRQLETGTTNERLSDQDYPRLILQ